MMAKADKTIAACVLGLVLGLALALSTGARAAEDGAAEAEQGASREVPPPPEVKQRRQFGQTITEYERHGNVFLMTVKPRLGPTQYWNDPDGDGQFQRPNSDDLDENMNLPKWRLGGW